MPLSRRIKLIRNSQIRILFLLVTYIIGKFQILRGLMSKSPSQTTFEETELSYACTLAISRVRELQINFLAIDFDLTIVDIHSGGTWKGSAEELVNHVRPLFQSLIHSAFDAQIKVAIVTFSSQVRLIEKVLEIIFPNFFDLIPIRGRDYSWRYDGAGVKEGKQSHIASAVQELEARFPDIDISKKTTLLIDDDGNNVKIALKEGVRAIRLNPKNSTRLLYDMQNLI